MLLKIDNITIFSLQPNFPNGSVKDLVRKPEIPKPLKVRKKVNKQLMKMKTSRNL